MRRTALPSLSILFAGLLSGCTGTGVFFDHTSQWFGANPNTPAGSSETFDRIRGQKVDLPPLLPEPGNVWPVDTGPDRTLQDLEKEQSEATRRAGGATPTTGPNPAVNRANNADRGLPPPQAAPGVPANVNVPTTNTPEGPALGTTGRGTGRGYRQLNTPSTGGSGILVPNGNGTSTLIGPDGSVQTVPSRP